MQNIYFDVIRKIKDGNIKISDLSRNTTIPVSTLYKMLSCEPCFRNSSAKNVFLVLEELKFLSYENNLIQIFAKGKIRNFYLTDSNYNLAIEILEVFANKKEQDCSCSE